MPPRNSAIYYLVRNCGRSAKAAKIYQENLPYIQQYMQSNHLTELKLAGYKVSMENGNLNFETYDPEEYQEKFDFMNTPDYQEKLF